jgi:hypothetical protein
MDRHHLRHEVAQRFTDVLKQDSQALSLLQLLADDTRAGDTARHAHWSGPFAALAEDAAHLRGIEVPEHAVGIWERDAASGDFVRARRHVDLWRFCANVERIGKKGARKRIAWLGESVARGFFFDPVYAPAHVLEQQLAALDAPVEVIDLAQSNCDPWWLAQLAASAVQLEPDAVVVFAGNNWRLGELTAASPEPFVVDGALIEAEHGFAHILERQHRKLDALAAQIVGRLADVTIDAGIPLVLVIPEINVADWVNCPAGTLDVPPLPAADGQRWIDAYRDARRALDQHAYADAEQHIRRAIALDGGTASASLDLLGQALRGQGRRDEEAYRTLRQSRDVIDDTRVVPSVFANVADTIRRVGAERGAHIVDLPRVFAEHTGDLLPGRRLFLDYCHHTAEGIRLATTATAQTVLPLLFERAAPFDALFAAAPSPGREQEGWAHLLAGIHNAHWGQDAALCSHHFRAAGQAAPALADNAVRQVYEAYRGRTSPSLLPAFDQLAAHPIAETYLVGFGVLTRSVVREAPLLTALSDAFPALGAYSPDPDYTLDELGTLDLLDAHWSDLKDRNRWYRRAYRAAYAPDSAFAFAVTTPRALSIALTARLPDAHHPGQARVELNGHAIGVADLGADWTSLHIEVPAHAVLAGLNQLSIHWPDVPREDRRARLRRDFEAGGRIDIRMHFAHLHQLTLTTTR